MNQKTLKTLSTVALAALSLFSLSLVGCGGGGGTEVDETINRTLIAGTGDSATLTSKKWRTVFLRVNGNYVGTGADQACPVSVDSKDGENSFDCDSNDALEMRSDGKLRGIFNGVEPGEEDTFDSIWTLSGDTFTLIDRTEDDTSQVLITFKLTNDGVVAGKQRVRMTIVSTTEEDGTTPRTDEAGFQLVIEEV